MGWKDFLDNLFTKPGKAQGMGDTVTVNIPAGLYYKQMALYTAVSLIANAVGKCEIKTFLNGKPVKQEDYFLLNIAPNINETSAQFWHKVVEKMIYTGEALVIEVKERLYCADSYCMEEYPILGNRYSAVVVGNFQFDREFSAGEVMLFRLDNTELHRIVSGMNEEYSKLIKSTADALKRSNGRKYKFKIDAVKAGDEEFEKEFEKVIKGQLEEYLQSDMSVYPEYEGYELRPEENQPTRSTSDFINLRKDMFEMIGSALKIPSSIMLGNITNMAEIVNTFLTFCIDPVADMITEVLNKHAGYENWIRGNYYRVKTTDIWHRDVFQLADKIDKLIASAFANIDEVRDEAGWEETGEAWAKQHVITKNYDKVESVLNNNTQEGKD